jgi:dTDP-4-amino-4,6-dideoxygalactose transaminase
MTFTATAEVIRYLGGDPVFLDVEYGSNLLTPAILEEAIARYPDVKYLAVVHYGGQAAPMREASGTDINTICRRNDIRIIEDAAHAFPSMCGGTMVGALGNVTCFSFYANKTITTGEGGMLTTDDEAVLKRVKVMRLHGINRDIWNRYTSSVPGWEYDVVAPGYKYNMPDTAAAIGLAQLERADEYRRGRERCAAYYYKHLGGVGSIDLPLVHGAMHEHSWHIYHIVLNEKAKILRNDLIDRLSAAGIGTSVHYKPLHRMTYYQERYGLKAEDFPNAERMWQGSVSLPIYPTLGEVELEYICTTVRTLLG